MNRFVAVQDMRPGRSIRELAESQIYGAIIMGICTALIEERIMDEQTGRMLNPDMEFYKLAGIGDIGEIVVHLDIRRGNDKRGVIGLGEPPAIGICAAIGNAVANAIGVRVPNMPMTPIGCSPPSKGGTHNAIFRIRQSDNGSGGGGAARLAKWGEADVLAGGTDLHQPHEGTPSHAQARGQHQEHQGARRHPEDRRRAAHRRAGHHGRTGEERRRQSSCPSRCAEAAAGIPSPQIRHMGTVGGDLCQRPRCWYYRQGFGLLAMKDGKSLVPDGENKYHAIFGNGGPAYFVSASSLGPALVALGAKVKLVSAKGTAEVAADEILRHAAEREQRARSRCMPNEILTEIMVPRGGAQERHLRSAAEGGARLASGDGSVSCCT